MTLLRYKSVLKVSLVIDLWAIFLQNWLSWQFGQCATLLDEAQFFCCMPKNILHGNVWIWFRPLKDLLEVFSQFFRSKRFQNPLIMIVHKITPQNMCMHWKLKGVTVLDQGMKQLLVSTFYSILALFLLRKCRKINVNGFKY